MINTEVLQNALLIGFAFGVVLGLIIVRASHRAEAVRGGPLAHLFHFLGASMFASTLPTVLATVFLGGGFLQAVATAFALVVISLALLLIYALFERPAIEHTPVEDSGWTAEKARTSGL
jgi:hypothetical protein